MASILLIRREHYNITWTMSRYRYHPQVELPLLMSRQSKGYARGRTVKMPVSSLERVLRLLIVQPGREAVSAP